MLGVAVGSYRVTARLGEGGMGAVYRGEHALLGRPVAIKVLLPRLSTNRDLVDRLFLEARTTSQIRHPGIVDVLDFGYTATGQAYLVMELLDGEALAHRMHQRGRMREAEAAAILRGVASALAAAHASGVVHRDLKPDNIFLVRDPELGERTKILDFGIAKLGDRAEADDRTFAADSVIGTPMYMAPEQCRGAADADHRADLYSLGCILYEMLTGRPPFASESTAALIAMHQSVEPESPRQLDPSISTAAELLLARLLAKRPEARLGSAAELVDELGQLAASGSYAALLGPRPRSSSVPMYLAPPAAQLLAPVIPATPTTLSGAASSTMVPVRRLGVRPRPARRARRVRPLFVAALAVVGIAGGVAGIAMLGGDPAPAVASPAPAHVQARK